MELHLRVNFNFFNDVFLCSSGRQNVTNGLINSINTQSPTFVADQYKIAMKALNLQSLFMPISLSNNLIAGSSAPKQLAIPMVSEYVASIQNLAIRSSEQLSVP